jgi:hypothetical protein
MDLQALWGLKFAIEGVPAFAQTLAGYGWQASVTMRAPAKAVHRSRERSERSAKVDYPASNQLVPWIGDYLKKSRH